LVTEQVPQDAHRSKTDYQHSCKDSPQKTHAHAPTPAIYDIGSICNNQQ
jgi:hypothetical protein